MLKRSKSQNLNPIIDYKTENKKFRIAVVGLGKQGTKLCSYLCNMGYNVIVVCDISSKNYKRIKNNFQNVQFEKKIDDLNKFNIDICIIATLATGKIDIIIKLFNLGVDKMLVEKPITNSISDNNKLKEFIKINNIKIQVYHPFLFSEQSLFFRQQIRDLNKGNFIKSSLFFKPSGLANIGSHAITTFLFLTDLKISKIVKCDLIRNKKQTGRINFEDPNANLILETQNGNYISIDNTSADCLSTNIFIEYQNLYVNVYNEKIVIKFKNIKDNDIIYYNKYPINTLEGKYRTLDNAISALINDNSNSIYLAMDAVEIILASHIVFNESRAIKLPLIEESKSYYNFS